MNTRLYPDGANTVQYLYDLNGILRVRRVDGTEIYSIDPVTGAFTFGTSTPILGMSRIETRRYTIAEVNAGIQMLPALPGYRYQMVRAAAMAIGGAAAAVTTVDINGTQSGSAAKLVSFPQASLLQGALLEAGSAGGTLLANGASLVACDVNRNINVGRTGANITTATHIHIIFNYIVTT